MTDCRKTETVIACFIPSDQSGSVPILHTTVLDDNGASIAGYFHDESGLAIDPASYLGGGAAIVGECPQPSTECVESQEWTYGIDNTGTFYSDVATYEIALSDGSTLSFSQDGSSGSWTAQLTEWANNIQAAADAAGLAWFVEPRFIDNSNPSNIDGTINGPGGTPSGLPGAPSVPIALALFDGGMAWRYVNFQICPGQPVPVSATRLTSTRFGDDPFDLTAAGAVLGPIQRFFVCRECGVAPLWYLEDGVTLANAGQIPNCYEPCGTLALTDAPPDRDCTFEIDVACDNNNSQNTVDFTNTITRRATICNGEQIKVDYFQADPNDPSALINYTLVGDFVDCATGEPVAVPVPECNTAAYAGKLWRISDETTQEATVDWWATSTFPAGSNAAPHGNVSDIFTVSADGRTLEHVNGPADVTFTLPTGDVRTSNANFVSAVGAASTAETSGNDQIRVRGYVILETDALLRDTNTNTGERGGIWINRCCAGDLTLLFEDTTDSVTNDTGVFDGVRIPKGIHYFEAVTSDLSAWQGFELSASYDDGETYSPLAIYSSKPAYNCVTLLRCNDSGVLIDRNTGDVVEILPTDLSCEPPVCDPCGCPDSGGETFDGNITDVTPNPDQTHVLVSGTGSVPAGLKTVTINNITGTTTIAGGFQLGTGRRVDSISFNATEIDRARGLLPAMAISGGTWQWVGLEAISEI